MLDAFIIQRIREDQKRSSERAAERLRIEVPPEEPPFPPVQRRESIPAEERGIAEIDFSI